MPEQTDNTKDAEENIQAEVDKALEKVREGDTRATIDLGVITPEVFKLLDEEPPKKSDALKNIAMLLLGAEAIARLLEQGGEEAVAAVIAPLIENLLLLLMTAVSLATPGVPPPSIPVIKKVLEILRDFEAAASDITNQQNQDEESPRYAGTLF